MAAAARFFPTRRLGARLALAASRTRSKAYGMWAASSKSFTPHTRRPCASRHVPKFSVWMSPTHSTRGAFLSSGQIVSISLCPAEVGRAKENKGAFPHPFVLVRKVGLDHLAPAAQPVLKSLVFFFE